MRITRVDIDGNIIIENTEITTEERVTNDKDFGQVIVDQFLGILKSQNLSVSNSVGLMQKFGGIQTLLSLGAIREASVLLRTVTPDEFLTLEIRTALIDQMNEYLSQYN